MEGVENDLDRQLLQHFSSRASAVLTLHGDKSSNPFTKILLPMALQHEGLMHSVLCLSASHMYRQPVTGVRGQTGLSPRQGSAAAEA